MSETHIPGMVITSLKFSYYEPTKHGIVIKIFGKVPKNTNFDYRSINLNLHGKFWKSLPLGLDKIIKWSYLPYSLTPSCWKKVVYSEELNQILKDFTLEIHIGTNENGSFGISYDTLYREIKKMATSNNSPIELEFLNINPQWRMIPFFSVYTTIPKIFTSLETQKEALYDGEIPKDIRSESFLTAFYEYFRWGLWPIIFLLFLLYSCFIGPEAFTDLVPKIFFTKELNTKIIEKLAPCPESLSQSWEVSRLEYELSLIENNGSNSNITRINEILVMVAGILGRKIVERHEIHSIYEEILKKENDLGVSTRITGFFNFVNILWIVAIIGITISVGPCIYTILRPLRTAIWEVALQIWHFIIIPLHSYGVFEILSYLICISLVTEGFRYSTDSGFYISLTGLFGSLAANAYTFFLRSKIKPNKSIYVFYNLLISLYILPLAIYYQSLLLGWLSVLCFYQAIGFSFIAGGLCYYVGFNSNDDMIRVSMTSAVVGVCFIGLKVLNISNYYMKPFASPLTVFSAILLLLALLIYSSRYYYHYGGNTFILRQIPMIIFLIGFLFFGNLYNMEGLKNTATVYLVFYLIEKYCDLHWSLEWNLWVLVFLFSVIIYKAALYLHGNPDILISMFNYLG